MRLSVHGSRSLRGAAVRVAILEAIETHGATALVTHAEPEGVCGEARALAQELAMPLHLHFLNFAKKRGAWEHRSMAVLRDSDTALLIHDGKSKGTANELALCVKHKVPHDVVKLDPTPGADPASDNAGLAAWAI